METVTHHLLLKRADLTLAVISAWCLLCRACPGVAAAQVLGGGLAVLDGSGTIPLEAAPPHHVHKSGAHGVHEFWLPYPKVHSHGLCSQGE